MLRLAVCTLFVGFSTDRTDSGWTAGWPNEAGNERRGCCSDKGLDTYFYPLLRLR